MSIAGVLAFYLALAPARPVAAEAPWLKDLAQAQQAAAAAKKPILIDFQAPWCYSCYYMEEHVLNRQAFARAAQGLVLLKIDVDLAEGRALKEKYRVSFLPSYVLVDEKGAVLGRIIGEQTEKDFLEKLKGLGAGAVEGPREKKLAGLRARLRLGEGGAEPLTALLALDNSCETAYDVSYGEKLLEAVSAEKRQKLLLSEKEALEKLVDEKIFKGQCADFRTGIDALAGVYRGLDLKEKRSGLLDRAIGFLEGRKLKSGEDRNHDDNLRYFLEEAGDDEKLRRLYPQLIAAYVSDYVYSYRFAKYLEGRKEYAPALNWIEKADKLCYGANRLAVTKIRAKILAGLGRKEEARGILRREIKVYGKSFPKETEGLQAALGEISK